MEADPVTLAAREEDLGSADCAGVHSAGSGHGSSTGAPVTCRICWMEADGRAGGALLSPCSCSGGLKYIHERCLKAWQQTQRVRDHRSPLRRCELCHTTYSVQLVRPRPKALQILLNTRSPAAELGVQLLIGEALKKLLEPSVMLTWWQEVMAVNMVFVGVKSAWQGFNSGLSWGSQHLVDPRLQHLNSAIVWLACLREWGPHPIRVAWQHLCPRFLPGPLLLLAQHPLHLALLLKWPHLVPGVLQAAHAFALGCWASLVQQVRELTELGLLLWRGARRLGAAVVLRPWRLARRLVRR